jgi:hypothetical protein
VDTETNGRLVEFGDQSLDGESEYEDDGHCVILQLLRLFGFIYHDTLVRSKIRVFRSLFVDLSGNFRQSGLEFSND